MSIITPDISNASGLATSRAGMIAGRIISWLQSRELSTLGIRWTTDTGVMADPQHVELARMGADAVSDWKRPAGFILDTRFRKRWKNRLDLRGANLRGVDLRLAPLDWDDLRGADLERANLSGAHLIRADLREAHLQRASFFESVLGDADLGGADLRYADLRKAFLQNANLGRANLSYAELDGALFNRAECLNTIFGDVNLSTSVGLEQVRHIGSSIISVGTLLRSNGRIPRIFLQGAGVPDPMIDYLQSLTGSALAQEFHTCFISFTDADDLFSQQLYKDLVVAGVHCWRWKEDAKWGRALMDEVDSAIRVYDKLVVVLSKASLKSEPVVREIERALQKEQRNAKEVLFPIRLDDEIFNWEHAMQADMVRKVIGDFRKWEDQANYAAALKNLIANLRTDH